MTKRFNYRLGNIEARVAMLNPNKGKETMEIVEWDENLCTVLAFFETEYEQERCTLLRRGIYHENTEDLMKVMRVASEFLKDEKLSDEGFHPID